MRIIKNIAIIFIVILFFLGCHKEKETENDSPEFIGYWCTTGTGDDNSEKVRLKINENYDAWYVEISQGQTKGTLNGETIITNNTIQIGKKFHFSIIENPHVIDTTIENVHICPSYGDYEHSIHAANWKMKLSGLIPKVYFPGPFTFYKVEY